MRLTQFIRCPYLENIKELCGEDDHHYTDNLKHILNVLISCADKFDPQSEDCNSIMRQAYSLASIEMIDSLRNETSINKTNSMQSEELVASDDKNSSNTKQESFSDLTTQINDSKPHKKSMRLIAIILRLRAYVWIKHRASI